MTDREAELRALADRVRERDAVRDAWLAKSFTDRLLVVDVRADATLPGDLRRELADRDLCGANEVYREADQGEASVGASGSAVSREADQGEASVGASGDEGTASREGDRRETSDGASGSAASREAAEDPSFAGDVGDAVRHQFVDVRTRGDHRSYVYD